MKQLLKSDQILTHYNPSLPIVMSCDAFEHGIGAVISHKFPNFSERLISFASHTLTSVEKKYSVIHKKALAIVWGITKFYQYLRGREFINKSDYKPLILLLGESKSIPKMVSGRLQR